LAIHRFQLIGWSAEVILISLGIRWPRAAAIFIAAITIAESIGIIDRIVHIMAFAGGLKDAWGDVWRNAPAHHRGI
jgi:hypothetical protein